MNIGTAPIHLQLLRHEDVVDDDEVMLMQLEAARLVIEIYAQRSGLLGSVTRH